MLTMSSTAIGKLSKTWLEKKAKEPYDKGDRKSERERKSAKRILKLKEKPGEFESLIQICVLAISIFNGMFSAGFLNAPLANFFVGIGMSQLGALSLAKLIVVFVVTYISLVLGRLVPLQIAKDRPMDSASAFPRLLILLSYVMKPIVLLLNLSSKLVIKVFDINPETQDGESQISAVIDSAFRSKSIDKEERELAKNSLMLDSVPVSQVMTRRENVIWLDVNDTNEIASNKVKKNLHPLYPLGNGSIIDRRKILGVVSLKDVLYNDDFELEKIVHDKYGSINMDKKLQDALDKMEKKNTEFLLVYDERGNLEGIVTHHDIADFILGDVAKTEDEKNMIKRLDDGTVSVDGSVSPVDLMQDLEIEFDKYEVEDIPDTIGGLINDLIYKRDKRDSEEGDKIIWKGYHVEVVDLDGDFIDKIRMIKTGSDDNNCD